MHFVSTFTLSVASFFIFLSVDHRVFGNFFPGTFNTGPFYYVHTTYHFLKSPWLQVPQGEGPGSESPLSVRGTLLVTPRDLPHGNFRIVSWDVFYECLSLWMCWSIIIKDVLLGSSLSSKSSTRCWLVSHFLLGSPVGGARGRWEGGGGAAADAGVCCAICCSTASPLNLAESLFPGAGAGSSSWFFSFQSWACPTLRHQHQQGELLKGLCSSNVGPPPSLFGSLPSLSCLPSSS